MKSAQRSVPDTTVSCSSGAGADPDSGFSGSVPASVRCSQLPQFILLFFVFYDALLIPEAGICPCCFSPLPTAPRSLRSYSISTCECLNRTCHMLQFSRMQVKRDDYVTQTFSDVANPFAH